MRVDISLKVSEEESNECYQQLTRADSIPNTTTTDESCTDGGCYQDSKISSDGRIALLNELKSPIAYEGNFDEFGKLEEFKSEGS